MLFYKPLHATGSVVRSHFAWLTNSGFKQFVSLSRKRQRSWLFFILITCLFQHVLAQFGENHSRSLPSFSRSSTYVSYEKSYDRFKNTICEQEPHYVSGPITKNQQKRPWKYNTTTLHNVIKRQKFETRNNKTLRVNSHVTEKTEIKYRFDINRYLHIAFILKSKN